MTSEILPSAYYDLAISDFHDLSHRMSKVNDASSGWHPRHEVLRFPFLKPHLLVKLRKVVKQCTQEIPGRGKGAVKVY